MMHGQRKVTFSYRAFVKTHECVTMTVYSFREQADVMRVLLGYYSLHNNPDERSFQLLRGESLKSCWRT